jgi:hypothetical protein
MHVKRKNHLSFIKLAQERFCDEKLGVQVRC